MKRKGEIVTRKGWTLKHRYPGTPLLWIAQSTAGNWYLFREINGNARAKRKISELYAVCLMRSDRRKAEAFLADCFL